jgi:uncharacterized membrane protein (GlpM family)
MKGIAEVDPSKLKHVKLTELGVRFAFGAAISVVTGVVSLVFDVWVGGLFLAFPAILPATATLIEENESNRAAKHDVMGATTGAVGLIAFAVVATLTLDRWSPPLALAAAMFTWVVVSVTCYLAYQAVRQR